MADTITNTVYDVELLDEETLKVTEHWSNIGVQQLRSIMVRVMLEDIYPRIRTRNEKHDWRPMSREEAEVAFR